MDIDLTKPGIPCIYNKDYRDKEEHFGELYGLAQEGEWDEDGGEQGAVAIIKDLDGRLRTVGVNFVRTLTHSIDKQLLIQVLNVLRDKCIEAHEEVEYPLEEGLRVAISQIMEVSGIVYEEDIAAFKVCTRTCKADQEDPKAQ